VLVDHTRWKLRHRQWTGTTEQLIEELESDYGRMYVSGRVDIFDMVDTDLFTVVSLNMMDCEEDVRYLGTLVKRFKLIEVYIEYGVTALDSYLRAPRFKVTLEEITDEPGSIAANKTKKCCC
nr:hypothetical protein [Tanacetum cinerariifolium]